MLLQPLAAPDARLKPWPCPDQREGHRSETGEDIMEKCPIGIIFPLSIHYDNDVFADPPAMFVQDHPVDEIATFIHLGKHAAIGPAQTAGAFRAHAVLQFIL